MKAFKNWAIKYLLPIFLLSFLSFYLFRGNMQLFPYHMHAWTQSDRLALAHGYTTNNMSLLLPTSPNLRPKFPAKQELTELQGITKADLPFTEYITAAVMLLSKSNSPAIFRYIQLLFASAGLLFFYTSLLKLDFHRFTALFSMLALMLAPVFSYYMHGFIPSITALAFSYAAIFYFIGFCKNKHDKQYAVALALFAIAVMIRPTFLMPMLAMVAVQVFYDLKSFKQNLRRLLMPLPAFLLLGIFYAYNKYLEFEYGSLFISQLMPATSFTELKQLLSQSWHNWKWDYFSPLHYLLLGLAVLLLIVRKNRSKWRPLIFFILLNIAAALAFLIAMAKQFPNHDYYFLDSLFFPLSLLLGMGIGQIRLSGNWSRISFAVMASAALLLMIMHSKKILAERYTVHGWDLVAKSYTLFDGSAAWLDSKGIGKEEPILVLDAYTANSPLLLMQRKGFTVLNTGPKQIKESLGWEYNYIAIPNSSLFGDILRNAPEVRHQLAAVANNGKIGIYTYEKEKQPSEAFQLLMPEKIDLLTSVEYDITQAESEFIPLLDTVFQRVNTQMNFYYHAEVQQDKIPNNKLFLVLEISKAEAEYYHYEAYPLHVFFENNNKAKLLEVLSVLPTNFPEGARIKYYIWKPEKNDLAFMSQSVYLTQYLKF